MLRRFTGVVGILRRGGALRERIRREKKQRSHNTDRSDGKHRGPLITLQLELRTIVVDGVERYSVSRPLVATPGSPFSCRTLARLPDSIADGSRCQPANAPAQSAIGW